ncbi:MAG: hypothetical protein MAG795_00962 [Candidatus Woesearchaeota archaeon]|nr:hypothetical protein [Candidatus Woesearchaeota archaeon]
MGIRIDTEQKLRNQLDYFCFGAAIEVVFRLGSEYSAKAEQAKQARLYLQKLGCSNIMYGLGFHKYLPEFFQHNKIGFHIEVDSFKESYLEKLIDEFLKNGHNGAPKKVVGSLRDEGISYADIMNRTISETELDKSGIVSKKDYRKHIPHLRGLMLEQYVAYIFESTLNEFGYENQVYNRFRYKPNQGNDIDVIVVCTEEAYRKTICEIDKFRSVSVEIFS